MSDAKRRAQEGLAKLVDKSLNALELSVTGTLPIARGSTRTSDARFVIAAVLEMQSLEATSQAQGSTMSADELAAKREQLRLARLAERKQQA